MSQKTVSGKKWETSCFNLCYELWTKRMPQENPKIGEEIRENVNVGDKSEW